MQHALKLLLKTTTRFPAKSPSSASAPIRIPTLRVLLPIYAALIALATSPVRAEEQTAVAGHIAVILPLKSDILSRHADAVRRGVQAAASNKEGLPVVVHATADDANEIQAVYDKAVSEGAQAVIGPLSRSAVTALTRGGKVRVPTLALNAPEGEVLMPRNLFTFGLQVDTEAKQLARMAARKGLKRALIVSVDTAVSSRVAQAFKDEWNELGGTVAEIYPYNADQTQLAKMRERIQATQADTVLLALDSARARMARPYISGATSVFATSLAYTSNDPLENFELDGVVFLDMPWLLLPDHPAVITYNQVATFSSLETQRFYALGIDAYRIAMELVKPMIKIDEEPLDGVTGLVLRGENQRFTRELTPAEFHNGVARVLGDTIYR